MMSINRYRLKRLAKTKHQPAKLTSKLLERVDLLIGVILIGNNLVNILAATIATVIAQRLWPENGEMISVVFLTLTILIFAEVTPKTLAALHPEKIAFPASYALTFLLKVMKPGVWLLNQLTTALLRLLGVTPGQNTLDHLSSDDLRTVVNEAGSLIPSSHQNMLLSILDLEKATVEDIMVPKNEIVGIDLSEDLDVLRNQFKTTQHTRLPVFDENIDDIKGFLHARNIATLLSQYQDNMSTDEHYEISKDDILNALSPVYFVPIGTPLNTQLLNFQRKKQRIGLVVNEYGDILGLVTIEDILEEIVGEFTSDFSATINKEIHPQDDGSILIDGTITIRELNKILNLDFPTDGPKTLSGLIIEYMENIPTAGTGLRLSGYPIEILHTLDNRIKNIKLWPDLKKEEEN